MYHDDNHRQVIYVVLKSFQSNRLYSRRIFGVRQRQETSVNRGVHRLSLLRCNYFKFINFSSRFILELQLHRSLGRRSDIGGSVHTHLLVLWPLLTLMAVGVAWTATIEDSFNRSLIYWLVLPPLLAGALAACSHFS
jgi:hypothetical protein